jgi:vacuolar-type H+-ATPase subunit I/STV1
MTKRVFIIVSAAFIFMSAVGLTSYKTVTEKQKAYEFQVLSAKQNTNFLKKEPTKEEVIAFRSESELRFRDTELMIFSIKAKTERQKGSVHDDYMKKVASLEEQLRFEKSRVEAFVKNPVNWDSFRPGFLKEMDAINLTAKNLYLNFGKSREKAIGNTQTDTYLAKLTERN